MERKALVHPHRSTRAVLAGVLLLTGLFMPGPTAGTNTTTALLPDLVMLQPGDFRLERKPGGVRWLRFSTVIANVGDGPFDVYGYEPTGAAITRSSMLNVRQRIVEGVDSTGSRVWSEHDAMGHDGSPATMFYSGDGHDHWHVFGLQEWTLAFEATPGDTIAAGAKTGFCFWDNVDLGWGMPKEYSGTWACHPNSDGSRVPMGQAVGWGDEYPATIAGQYIDITKYPYGNYCLTLVADPRGEFIEQTTANNTVRTLISIRSGGVTILAQDCAQDTEPPATPTGLSAIGGDGSVSLDWTDNDESDLAQYLVYRDAGTVAIATATSSNHLDAGLSNGTPYCYAVSAVDSSGNESPRSGDVCATPTEGTGSDTLHVADLEVSSQPNGRYWRATVVVSTHDGAHATVSGADVSGSWSGVTGAVSCTTDETGACSLASDNVLRSTGSVTFTVTSLSSGTATYLDADNHDADGDSDGTTITVSKP